MELVSSLETVRDVMDFVLYSPLESYTKMFHNYIHVVKHHFLFPNPTPHSLVILFSLALMSYYVDGFR